MKKIFNTPDHQRIVANERRRQKRAEEREQMDWKEKVRRAVWRNKRSK